MSAPALSATVIDTSLITRARQQRSIAIERAKRHSLAFAASVVGIWAIAITAAGLGDRVAANAAAAATMVFGSFVAGSTPQGGGAVAFPVFTKLLGVSATDAATFSLSIQAIGMGSATVIMALTRRAVDRGALRLTVPSAVVGYLSGTALFSAISLPSAYVKVFFTLVVLTAGAATVLCQRRDVIEQLSAARLDSAATRRAMIAVAGAGGVASALFGSGADVAVYLLLTIALGVRPSIGVATSVITMAAVSVVGLITSLLTGALDPAVITQGTDIFGMWLAAVPVVVLGAPIGSWCASRVSPRVLTGFIGTLAAAEFVSTALFLGELRTDPGVALFAATGLVLTVLGVRRLLDLRDRIATDRQPLTASVRRLDLDVGFTK